MKAVIYARYSCDNQREESIEGQLRECKAFAARKGLTVAKTYIDRAISAKTDNRHEFQRMIKDSAKCLFDIVIVWKLDRFARNRYDSAHYKAALRKNGVKVVSATEVISEGAEGIILESVLEGYAEYYSAELSEKVIRGMTENCLHGISNGGKTTFGYRVNGKTKKYEEDTLYAPVVTEIFNRYAGGETIRHIIDDLTNRGIKNNNKPLSYHFVNCLLNNRRYLGEYSFRGQCVKDAIPALVTQEIYDKCQQRLDENKHKGSNFKPTEEKFLMTGKIFCGVCGEKMVGISGRGRREKRYHYYQCAANRRKKCGKKTLRKDDVENIVANATMDIFADEKLINQICDTCYEMQSNTGAELNLLKKRLKDNKREISNIMKAIKQGLVTKSTKAELEKLESEQEEIEALIIQEEIERPTLSREDIKEWIMSFSKTDLSNIIEKQRLIDLFVNCVFVYEDKIVVFLNYKYGVRCIDISDWNNADKKREHPKTGRSSPVSIGIHKISETPSNDVGKPLKNLRIYKTHQ